jgi:hypothetical protein
MEVEYMPIRYRLSLSLLVLAWVTLACTGYNLPQTAQRGSTIAIPFAGFSWGAYWPPLAGLEVGFGGTQHTDYQRGTMIFKLDEPTGFELIPRVTTALLSHPAAGNSRGTHPEGNSGVQFVSIVDIPTDAPLGRHNIYLVRRAAPGQPGSDIDIGLLDSTISILPEDIEVNGGAETIWGTSTPFGGFWNHIFIDRTAEIHHFIPDPQLRITLGPWSPWAVELQIQYPADVINIVDALEFSGRESVNNETAVVWLDDNVQGSQGTVTVAAAAKSRPFDSLSLVFTLDDGASQTLDLATLPTPSVLAAYDANGVPLPGVTVSSVSIW